MFLLISFAYSKIWALELNLDRICLSGYNGENLDLFRCVPNRICRENDLSTYESFSGNECVESSIYNDTFPNSNYENANYILLKESLKDANLYHDSFIIKYEECLNLLQKSKLLRIFKKLDMNILSTYKTIHEIDEDVNLSTSANETIEENIQNILNKETQEIISTDATKPAEQSIDNDNTIQNYVNDQTNEKIQNNSDEKPKESEQKEDSEKSTQEGTNEQGEEDRPTNREIQKAAKKAINQVQELLFSHGIEGIKKYMKMQGNAIVLEIPQNIEKSHKNKAENITLNETQKFIQFINKTIHDISYDEPPKFDKNYTIFIDHRVLYNSTITPFKEVSFTIPKDRKAIIRVPEVSKTTTIEEIIRNYCEPQNIDFSAFSDITVSMKIGMTVFGDVEVIDMKIMGVSSGNPSLAKQLAQAMNHRQNNETTNISQEFINMNLTGVYLLFGEKYNKIIDKQENVNQTAENSEIVDDEKCKEFNESLDHFKFLLDEDLEFRYAATEEQKQKFRETIENITNSDHKCNKMTLFPLLEMAILKVSFINRANEIDQLRKSFNDLSNDCANSKKCVDEVKQNITNFVNEANEVFNKWEEDFNFTSEDIKNQKDKLAEFKKYSSSKLSETITLTREMLQNPELLQKLGLGNLKIMFGNPSEDKEKKQEKIPREEQEIIDEKKRVLEKLDYLRKNASKYFDMASEALKASLNSTTMIDEMKHQSDYMNYTVMAMSFQSSQPEVIDEYKRLERRHKEMKLRREAREKPFFDEEIPEMDYEPPQPPQPPEQRNIIIIKRAEPKPANATNQTTVNNQTVKIITVPIKAGNLTAKIAPTNQTITNIVNQTVVSNQTTVNVNNQTVQAGNNLTVINNKTENKGTVLVNQTVHNDSKQVNVTNDVKQQETKQNIVSNSNEAKTEKVNETKQDNVANQTQAKSKPITVQTDNNQTIVTNQTDSQEETNQTNVP
ncbi:hypothetical protein TVAG_153260 [Trichomonas vaginalis G3]|uniref:Uncharacterized protein n=1 Tax=Trichomonas vaginalis (strain ATCC PRA-98 / G3) TaxID=412133 RepID=A2FYY0_TRIV3|nr:hypothetical protein TVAGG3_0521140 [Trichomonas vaginalis G3]EAX89881.1 hypothetical protein TVAG_153260 [Trichomonas vaginalis G3]KAI5518457.1 hypothetical protein TVAGG3_0521140 [Trichomonas vaginalis G3]|eukprot:XP_001302811.1 hypothetical protein [Trichomonas vaginalis G3]